MCEALDDVGVCEMRERPKGMWGSRWRTGVCVQMNEKDDNILFDFQFYFQCF